MADKKISALTSATAPLSGTEEVPIVQSGTTKKVTVANLTAGRSINVDSLTASGNTILGDATTDTLNVGAGGLVKDSSGNVGVGTAAPVFGNGSGLQVSRNGVACIRVTNATAVTSMEYVTDATGGLISARGNFPLRFDNTGGLNLTLETNGNVTVNRNNLVVGTAGKGIDFSANGGDVLSQYDEGTWNITWVGLTGTPSNTVGRYTRIGRLVFFTYAAGANVIQGAAGSTYFNLPFTPGEFASGSFISQTVVDTGGIDIEIYGYAYTTAFNAPYMVFSGVYNI